MAKRALRPNDHAGFTIPTKICYNTRHMQNTESTKVCATDFALPTGSRPLRARIQRIYAAKMAENAIEGKVSQLTN
ncbi:MAG: hypothetical protein K6F50_09500, partial [Kiritimatiellae bacterium]|nr:hypothetical protein [Kiritimatiellia bacterium]